MIATSRNMVHGALRTIIIHEKKKKYWIKRVRLTHWGLVNMDISVADDPGNAKDQGISSHGIAIALSKYSGLSRGEVK